MGAQTRYMFQNNPNDPSSRGNPQRPNNGTTPGGNSSGFLIRAILFMVLVLLGWYMFRFFTDSGSSATPNAIDVPYSTFIQEVQKNNVKSVLFQGQDVNGVFITPVSITDTNNKPQNVTNFHFTQLPTGFNDPNLTTLLLQHNVAFEAKLPSDNNLLLNILFSVLPWIVVFGALIFFLRRASQSQQNIFSFGKSRAKVVLEDRPSTTFADVAGVDEAKNDLVEVVEFL